MKPFFLLTFIVALMLAAVHLFAARLHFLDVIPRSRWLSAAGGVGVSYVFLHLLPELAESQEQLRAGEESLLVFIEHHVYFVALTGLVCFYGLERLVKQVGYRNQRSGPVEETSALFWLHIAAFILYNLLVGYLLVHREQTDSLSLLWYAIAMVLHFFVTDYGLRQDHRQVYSRLGRWLLASAVLLGWVLGVMTVIPDLIVPVLLAFLAGGVILNVLKEELPEDRESHFGAFLAGVLIYSVVLLAV